MLYPIFRFTFSKFTLLGLFFCFSVLVKGQNCPDLFELPKNARYEYDLLDKKQKSIGRVRNIVLSQAPDSMQTELVIKTGIYKGKNKLKHSGDFYIRCNNDSVYYDKMLLQDFETLQSFEGKETIIEGTDVLWPLKMEPEQRLPEGNLHISVLVFNRVVATINHRVYDRKVLGSETITTPAGTFNCYKISYKYEVVLTGNDMTLKKRDYITEYFSPKHGIIKTQFISKSGRRKLEAIVLLSKTQLP